MKFWITFVLLFELMPFRAWIGRQAAPASSRPSGSVHVMDGGSGYPPHP